MIMTTNKITIIEEDKNLDGVIKEMIMIIKEIETIIGEKMILKNKKMVNKIKGLLDKVQDGVEIEIKIVKKKHGKNKKIRLMIKIIIIIINKEDKKIVGVKIIMIIVIMINHNKIIKEEIEIKVGEIITIMMMILKVINKIIKEEDKIILGKQILETIINNKKAEYKKKVGRQVKIIQEDKIRVVGVIKKKKMIQMNGIQIKIEGRIMVGKKNKEIKMKIVLKKNNKINVEEENQVGEKQIIKR